MKKVIVGWFYRQESEKQLVLPRYLEWYKEQFPDVEFEHRFIQYGTDSSMYHDVNVEVRLSWAPEWFVRPDTGGITYGIDEDGIRALISYVHRGIEIHLDPEKFTEELRKNSSFAPKFVLGDDGDDENGLPPRDLTLEEIQEEADIVGRASKGSDPELEATLEALGKSYPREE